MPGLDLRVYKAQLRRRYKEERARLDPERKARMDAEILRRLTALEQYRACRMVMVYVSTGIEVDTRALIARAFADGKRVAAPRCIPGTHEMEFHEIGGMEELSPGAFGVLEPAESAPVVREPEAAFLVAPALAIDSFGYRLGYGGGYYDRYLAGFTGPTAGICYFGGYRFRLHHGRFDCPLDWVVTERFARPAGREERPGSGGQKNRGTPPAGGAPVRR